MIGLCDSRRSLIRCFMVGMALEGLYLPKMGSALLFVRGRLRSGHLRGASSMGGTPAGVSPVTS